jgi:hypothetical protein
MLRRQSWGNGMEATRTGNIGAVHLTGVWAGLYLTSAAAYPKGRQSMAVGLTPPTPRLADPGQFWSAWCRQRIVTADEVSRLRETPGVAGRAGLRSFRRDRKATIRSGGFVRLPDVVVIWARSVQKDALR